MKTCNKCGIEKSATEFYQDKRLRDGLQGRCKPCMIAATAESVLKTPEKRRAREIRQRQKNPGRSTNYVRKWRSENPARAKELNAPSEKRREIDRIRYAINEKRRASVDRRSREFSKRNPDIGAARVTRRRTALLQRNVAWADQVKIRKIYAEAKRIERETGIPHEVDHIVPLRGKTVSGLHWEGNLQILPKVANIRKGNRYWPDMPGSV